MKKTNTGYRLQTNDNSIKILKDDKVQGHVMLGITSALEAIFVMENMTKKDWLICEDDKVYLVSRAEIGKGAYSETE